MQDPWVSNYYENKPKNERPKKYMIARTMHKKLEPYAMRKVDAIISVTNSYVKDLCQRYDWIDEKMCKTIPFGASNLDFEIFSKINLHNNHFNKIDGKIHASYVGVLGKVMKKTCLAICYALRMGLEKNSKLFSNIKLHFIGTDYATGSKSSETIAPLARKIGVKDFINEETSRVPYFEMIKILQDSDFLIIVGSDDPNYSASKIYPYILSKKPILSIFHKNSNVNEVLLTTNSSILINFGDNDDSISIAKLIYKNLKVILENLPFEPDIKWSEFKKYSSYELTRQQCELFDSLIN